MIIILGKNPRNGGSPPIDIIEKKINNKKEGLNLIFINWVKNKILKKFRINNIVNKIKK